MNPIIAEMRKRLGIDHAGPVGDGTPYSLTAAEMTILLNTFDATVYHHNQKADDRCIEDDDKLYLAAGLGPCDRRVGDKTAMLANCARFIEKRCAAGGWPTYAELEAEVKRLRSELKNVEDVYVVGSEEYKFICDRVYFAKDEAIAYANERAASDGYKWSVYEAPNGLDWMFWTHVHGVPADKERQRRSLHALEAKDKEMREAAGLFMARYKNPMVDASALFKDVYDKFAAIFGAKE